MVLEAVPVTPLPSTVDVRRGTSIMQLKNELIAAVISDCACLAGVGQSPSIVLRLMTLYGIGV